jgi:dihydrofolate synthase/folylpolyglutamate synthase
MSEILEWIDSLEPLESHLGLERIQKVLELLGHPEERFKSILVAGTNGKGSTAAFLSHILEANNYKTGFYSSPHLVGITERIQVDQKPISVPAFEKEAVALRELFHANGIEIRHFEFLTALALNWFAKQKAEWAVLEVGMGGRLDATNAVNAEASCITNIALDHQQYLGNTVREIAFEKAGIIKKEKPLVTSEKKTEIIQLFSELASSQKSPFFCGGKEYSMQLRETGLNGTTFDFSGFSTEWKKLHTRLIGEHQAHNAGLALATLFAVQQQQNLRLAEGKTRKALEKTVWPGRFEILSEKPLVILDCCHNPAGAETFSKSLQSILPNTKAKWLIGVSNGRKPKEMLNWFAPLASEIVFSRASFKGQPAEELLKNGSEFLPSYKLKAIPTVSEAVQTLFQKAQPTDVLIVAGSIYLVGEAMQSPWLKRLKTAGKKKRKAKKEKTEPEKAKEKEGMLEKGNSNNSISLANNPSGTTL